MKNRWIKKKVDHSRISNPECPDHKNRKHIREGKNAWRIFCIINKIDPYFYAHYKEKLQVGKDGCEYILFRIYVYFTEYLLAAQIDEIKHVGRDLIFEEKKQKALGKILGCEFIGINASKCYDENYEIGRR